jgi:SAM-dependent methyltransferase
MKNKTHSFVSFYTENNISPVSQNIEDLEKHFQRRDSLLRSLGILPGFVEGMEIIEFGPGSGHNAFYTASLSPQKYFLVDGNPLGIKQTRERLSRINLENCQVFNSLFLDYPANETFDIVWAEGCIPHQSDPISILKHLSLFVKPDGAFVFTTINSISYLSETIRRLIFNVCLPADQSVESALEKLRPLLSSHLSQLKGMSRPIDDWILDNIIHPLQNGQLLSIPDVIEGLQDRFDFYGSSPRFITDWRWYKEIIGRDRGFNQNSLDCYYQNNLNLIDYRYCFPPHSVEFGKNLEEICDRSWKLMCQIQQGDSSKWQSLFDLMDDISSSVRPLSPETANAIDEASQWLRDGAPSQRELHHFPQWWGRGQQYLSMIRKHDI